MNEEPVHKEQEKKEAKKPEPEIHDEIPDEIDDDQEEALAQGQRGLKRIGEGCSFNSSPKSGFFSPLFIFSFSFLKP